MEVFNTDLEDVKASSTNNIMQYLCNLEGYKVKLKNLHWSATCMSIHTRIDELTDELNEFEDLLAETYQGIYTQFDSNFLRASIETSDNIYTLVDKLLLETKILHSGISEMGDEVILKSIVEDFISYLYKFKYLLKIIKRGNNE